MIDKVQERKSMMKSTIKAFVRLFKQALENLYDKERVIVANEVNERCMAAHVFAFMKSKWNSYLLLKSYDIDYEYNREGLGGVPKQLYCRYSDEKNAKWHWIIPDLIIHKRGDTDNFVVIEFKKWGIPYNDDRVKLTEMTKQNNDGKCKYRFGWHVIFGCKIDLTQIEVFVDGESVQKGSLVDLNDLTEILIERLEVKNLLSDGLRKSSEYM